MTIYGVGYRALSYEPVPRWRRLLPLVRQEFAMLFRSRPGILVYLICLWFIIRQLFFLYISLGVELGEEKRALDMVSRIQLDTSPYALPFYLNHSVRWGFMPFVVLTCLVSVRSIAADRAANALEIYWTRGISPWDYFLAKWLGSAKLLGSVFVAGPLLLWLVGIFLAPDWDYFETTWQFMPQVLLALLLQTAAMSFLATGFSALSKSANVATFLWVMLLLVSWSLGRVLTEIERHSFQPLGDTYPWYQAFCPWYAMNRIVDWVAGVARSDQYPVSYACICLAAVYLPLLWQLHRRLRSSETIT